MEEELKQLKEDMGVAMEKVGKLEGELDKVTQANAKLEKVVVRLIDQLATHMHLPDGKAAVALAE